MKLQDGGRPGESVFLSDDMRPLALLVSDGGRDRRLLINLLAPPQRREARILNVSRARGGLNFAGVLRIVEGWERAAQAPVVQ